MRFNLMFSFFKVFVSLKINILKDFIGILILYYFMFLFCRRFVLIIRIFFLEFLVIILLIGIMEIWINRFLGKFYRIYLLIFFKSFGFCFVFLVILFIKYEL